ncbi:hypothetical protein SAMN06297382_0393 [Amphiplicatus metriothermophilus]|uniref:Peptidase propeptide and YPEB domain-containing protein n=2 Tax=Amphiplicatus metriothermophilus TaxID=1519374 RepID=A0A239PK24_9PROT|nr:hypothetical protein SAMN06297382_0393 [Amphiplicatus metriothermophilus]
MHLLWLLLLLMGLASVSPPALSAPNLEMLPQKVQERLKQFKIGEYNAPVFKDGQLTGYAILIYEANRLVSMQTYGLADAPLAVRSGASASDCGGPTVTWVGEDSHNVYYYAEFPDGSWTYYAVNKETGAVTVIASGREAAEIC